MQGFKPTTLALLIGLVMVPTRAQAQGSIAGTVKDTSSAVLPGVTVEAASSALIEKVRSVVTDGTGQYKIVDLRPGTYTVTFTLPGFSLLRREGIELTGSFAATVNADLKVGAVAETITVSGEAPIVDVQSVTQERVIQKEIIDAIPSGRTHMTVAALIPGTVGSFRDVGGTNNLTNATMSIHGGNANDTRVMVDGISTQNAEQSGGSSNHLTDMASTQEITVDFAASTAEAAYAGLRFNLIPREGGNTFTGSFFGTYANENFQGSNLTQDLKDRGLSTINSLKEVYDVNPSAGGPIVKNKLWFFTAARWVKTDNYVGGRFYNLNAGNPDAWTYVADTTRRANEPITQRTVNGRMTWQATAKNKFSFYYDDQGRCWCNYFGPQGGIPPSPEASNRLAWPKNRVATAAWSSPLTSRLLLEVRFADRAETYDYAPLQPDDSPNFDLIQVTEQSTGITYRSMGTGTLVFQVTPARIWQASTSLSYVTGAHAVKVGFSDVWIDRQTLVRDNKYDVSYRFNNGVPNLITERAMPWAHHEKQRAELGLYAQDKWTLNRLTLNLGLRYDWYNSYYPEQHLGPGPLVPNRDLTFPETQGLNFKDLTPRFGAAYNLFGNGKTAIKVNIGKYPVAVGIAQGVFGEAVNPAARLTLSTTRSWNDSFYPVGDPLRQNYVPDCDLLNPLANGECGTMADVNFGKTLQSTIYNPRVTTGWGVRQYQWELSTSVQQELAPRISMNVGYFRRIFGNFLATDNLLVAPSDYSPFSITAPADARLPSGGGYQVAGLYDLNPNKVGQVNNLLGPAGDFGNQTQHWNGIDATLDARLQKGVVVQGGLSTGRNSTDNCDVVGQVDNPSALYCHVDTQFLTQVKLLGTYTIPKAGLQIAATFQSMPGPQISALYNAPNAVVAPSLGRALSGGAQNVTVNLVEPGTMYGERSTELDLRMGKILRFGRTRTSVNLDLYNVFNNNAVLTENANFATWRVPITVLQPRLAKFTVQVDF